MEQPATQRFMIFMVSDGTGETGGRFLEAALHQFEAGRRTHVRRFALVRRTEDIRQIIEDARTVRPLVLHTIVHEEIRSALTQACEAEGLQQLDMLGPLFNLLGEVFREAPAGASGVLHEVNHKYYQRIEAIEYTLRHDDGRLSKELHRADIILLGVSRTSKTPTSVFLAQKGYRVANIPIVLNLPLPDTLASLDQRRIVGLTIDPARLAEIRRIRMQRMGMHEGDYADHKVTASEVSYAEGLYRKHRQWPVIDVTDRAIEETSDHILNVIYGKDRSIIS